MYPEILCDYVDANPGGLIRYYAEPQNLDKNTHMIKFLKTMHLVCVDAVPPYTGPHRHKLRR